LLIYLKSFIFIQQLCGKQPSSLLLSASMFLVQIFFTVAAKSVFRHLKDLIVNFSALTELQIQKAH